MNLGELANIIMWNHEQVCASKYWIIIELWKLLLCYESNIFILLLSEILPFQNVCIQNKEVANIINCEILWFHNSKTICKQFSVC